MARAGRKDRGLLSKLASTGKLLWYVRLYHEGKERRFGSFSTKTSARVFYEKAKQEQNQGRFFPERFQHGGKETAAAVIASYLATLPTSGKKPTTIAVEQYYGQWWTARLEGKAPGGRNVTLQGLKGDACRIGSQGVSGPRFDQAIIVVEQGQIFLDKDAVAGTRDRGIARDGVVDEIP